MASQIESKVIGDILQYEAPNAYSREKKVVADSQTLVVGSVLQENSSGEVILAAATDEVQTIGITGTLTAGSFTLTFVDLNGAVKTTDPIAYGADTAAVQAGVDTALGASKVTAGGTAITAMTFTFDGTGYTGLGQTLIVIDVSGLTGEEDATVTLTTSGGGGAVTAVCLEKVTTTTDNPSIPVLVRHAIVNKSQLDYGAVNEAAANATLLSLGILTRD